MSNKTITVLFITTTIWLSLVINKCNSNVVGERIQLTNTNISDESRQNEAYDNKTSPIRELQGNEQNKELNSSKDHIELGSYQNNIKSEDSAKTLRTTEYENQKQDNNKNSTESEKDSNKPEKPTEPSNKFKLNFSFDPIEALRTLGARYKPVIEGAKLCAVDEIFIANACRPKD